MEKQYIQKVKQCQRILQKDESKIEGFAWPTNLVGRMRILCQYQNGSAEYVGYGIAYLVLVFLYNIFRIYVFEKGIIYGIF